MCDRGVGADLELRDALKVIDHVGVENAADNLLAGVTPLVVVKHLEESRFVDDVVENLSSHVSACVSE